MLLLHTTDFRSKLSSSYRFSMHCLKLHSFALTVSNCCLSLQAVTVLLNALLDHHTVCTDLILRVHLNVTLISCSLCYRSSVSSWTNGVCNKNRTYSSQNTLILARYQHIHIWKLSQTP